MKLNGRQVSKILGASAVGLSIITAVLLVPFLNKTTAIGYSAADEVYLRQGGRCILYSSNNPNNKRCPRELVCLTNNRGTYRVNLNNSIYGRCYYPGVVCRLYKSYNPNFCEH